MSYSYTTIPCKPTGFDTLAIKKVWVRMLDESYYFQQTPPLSLHCYTEYPRSGHLLNSILLIFHNQGSVVKSVSSTNAHSRFASVVVDSVLEAMRLARHTWLCPCISGSNARGESRALEGCRDSNDLFYKKETEKKLVSGQTWSTRRKKPIIAVFLVQFMHHHSKGQHEKKC